MREPNKAFAFAGDWHMNGNWAQDVINNLRDHADVDTILHAGDYGYTFEKAFRDNVEQACIDNDVFVYFVDGNHDDHGWLWNKPRDDDGLYFVSDHVRGIPRGFRWNWWGKSFIGIGGAVSVDRYWRKKNISWWPTETLTQDNYLTAIEAEHADVWLSHDCPAFIPIPGIIPGHPNGWPVDLIREAESHRDLLYRIYDIVKPDVLVHGHYHRTYKTQFRGTRVRGLHCDGSSVRANTWVVKSVDDLTGAKN